MQAASAIDTTAHGNAWSLTHLARPGIEPVSSRMLVRFVSAEIWWELPIFFLFGFLGLHLRHMEVPRLGVESEPQPQHLGIRVAPVIHSAAHGNARSPIHWSRPGIEPASSWILVGVINSWATKGTPIFLFFNTFFFFCCTIASGSSWARDWTHTTAATQAAAVTMLGPWSAVPQENSCNLHLDLNISVNLLCLYLTFWT